MYKSTLIVLFLLSIPGFVFAQSSDPIDVTIGKEFKIYSEALEQSRDVFIGLPDSYYQGSRSYPVIYVLDGHGHFAPTQITARYLASVHMMDEVIVVGVGQNNRNTELGPGQREEFRSFLTQELRDWISKRYRSSEGSVLIGHSLGGSYNWYQALKDAEAFDAMISISPVLKREKHPGVPEIVAALPEMASSLKHIYVTVGSEHISFREPIEAFEKALDESGLIEHRVTYYPNETHGSVPMPAMYEALKFVWEGWITPRVPDLYRLDSLHRIKAIGGMKKMQAYYVAYSDSIGYEVSVPDILWSRLAWTYVNNGHREELIDLVDIYGKGHEAVLNWVLSNLRGKTDFELAETLALANVGHHPNSANALFQLAQVHAAQNRNEDALSGAKTALDLIEEANPLKKEIEALIAEL